LRSSQKARDYAFLLLKYRPRSELEVRQRLKKKNFDTRITEETISFLKERDFINDDSFARNWIESRIKRPLGIRRLKAELIIKGIDKTIIDNRINEIKENYPEEEIVSRIVRERLIKSKGSDPQKARKRIYAYLLRRGFSSETVINVISQLNEEGY